MWPDTIPAFQLEFQWEQWEYACEYYWQDIYIPAQFTCGEYTLDCMFRIRGATSREYPKKSIKIEFAQGTSFFGSDELNLNAEYLDKSRLRELLSYLYYGETGQIVPEVHLAEVVFNGETQGAYVSVQDVDGDFLLNTQLPDEAVIYKCSDRYTTLDRPGELAPYSKKTFETQPWDDLVLLIYWLLLSPDEDFAGDIHERFHYEDLVSCIATNVLLGHCSTYYHNYHLLLDRTGAEGKWRYITWDMDRTWGKYGPEFPYWRNSSNDGNRRNTLLVRMWCNPSIRADLIQEIESQYPLLLSFTESGKIDSLAGIIAPLVESDPYRDFAMDQFWNAVEAIKSWPEARYGNLQNQFTQWPLPFRIYPVEAHGTDLLVSWSNGGTGCSWRLAVSPDSLFTHEEDLIYQAFTTDTFFVLPGEYSGLENWLQLYCTRNGTEHRAANGPVKPEPEPGIPSSGSMVVSEINYMSSPVFNPGDWFEAVNTGETAINLAGWSIRDANPENLTTLGELVVQPGECIVLASDSFLFSAAFPTLPAPRWSLSFNLSDGGDEITLADPSGATADTLRYLPEYPWPDVSGNGTTLILRDLLSDNSNPFSWIRGPLGGTPFSTGSWNPQWPENGAVGMKLTGPIPSSGNIMILLTAIAPVTAEVEIRDLAGRKVTETVSIDLESGEYSLTLETRDLPSGVYFAVMRNMGFTQAARITLIGE